MVEIQRSYVQVFEEDYDERFTHVRVVDIVEDMKSSKLVAANPITTYIR